MSWNTPRTWITGELVTAALMNTHLRDNLDYLYDGNNIGARVYNSANISIPDSTYYVLPFDSERYDTDNIHSTVTNTGRLTAQTAGKYLVIGHLWMQGSNAYGELGISINGFAVARQTRQNSPSNVSWMATVSTIYDFAVGEAAELIVYHTHGTALTAYAANNFSLEFAMHRIGES